MRYIAGLDDLHAGRLSGCFDGSLLFLQILRSSHLCTTLDPYLCKLRLDLLPTLLPFVDLGQTLTKLCQLVLYIGLLTGSADALEIPFIACLAETERQGELMVALERSASGNCDESWRLLACGSFEMKGLDGNSTY
jgi:hypothetical protein